MKDLLRIACLLSFAVAIPAQHRVVGRYVRSDGTPVAGGTVTFATSAPIVYDTFTPPQVVTVTTDDEGRFEAKLRDGAHFSVWGFGPADANAVRAGSNLLEHVTTGDVVELVASDPADRSFVHLRNLEVLPGRAPFRLFVRANAVHGPSFELPVGADGSLRLPDLPPGGNPSRLVDADGIARWTWGAWGGAKTGQAIPVGKPLHGEVHVRDERGEPIAGAAVAVHMPQAAWAGDWFVWFARDLAPTPVVAHTDADGVAQFASAAFQGTLLVSAPGYDESFAGRSGGREVVDGALGEMVDMRAAAKPFQAVLHAGEGVRGRVHDGGRPLPGVGVRLGGKAMLSYSSGGVTVSSGIARRQLTRTDADGRFAFTSPPRDAATWQFAVDFGDADAPPLAMLPRRRSDRSPLDIDLAAMTLLDVQVRKANGAPAANSLLALRPGDPELADFEPIVLPLDRGGRTRVRVQPGAWFVFTRDAEDFTAELLHLDPTATSRLDLAMRPLARMRGTVIHDGLGDRRLQDLFFGVSGTRGTDHLGEFSPLDLLLREHLQWMNHGLTKSLEIDDAGHFSIGFVPAPGRNVTFEVGEATVELREVTDCEVRPKQR